MAKPAVYAFGEFEVGVDAKCLRRGDTPVQIPSRALDALLYLIEHRDRPVPKDELIAAIWNDVIVTDDSLIHAISVLRRTLGDERHQPRYIQTIPRRGYRFVGSVRPLERRAAALRQELPAGGDSAANTSVPAGETGTLPTSKARFPWTSAGWTLAIGILLALVLTQMARREDDSPSAASIRLFQPAPPDTSIVSGGLLSPDGRYLLFVARDETLGKTALWARALRSDELRKLDGTEGASKPFWSPDSERIGFFARGKLLATDLTGGEPRSIASVTAAAGGAWGPDDTILFAEWSSGLFSVPASGDGSVRMVAGLDREAEDISFAWPQFFPDGHRFVYQIVSLDPARTGVYVHDLAAPKEYRLLDTTSPATLAPPDHLLHVRNDMLIAEEIDLENLELTGHATIVARGISEPSLAAENFVSASSNLLAFQQGVSRQNLVWYDRDGQRIGTLAMPTVLYNPRISPDGSRLLGSSSITTDPGLWLARLDREEYARLETDALGPVWSPDGRRIAFTSRSGFDLLIRSIDSPAARLMLASDDSVKILNDWSPDSSQLVFTRQGKSTGLDLWTLDIERRQSRTLIATPHSETQARISPDGKWIAYASDESGIFETYVSRFPSLAEKRVVSVGGGGQPQWRSDQAELFYLSLDRTIMAVGVKDGDPIGFAAPRPLFRPSIAGDPGDARDYFAADAAGKRFLIDSSVNENSDQIITVVVNWAEGLRASTVDKTGSLQAAQ